MNLSELPLELIDEILKHLDAISLARSRQVCRAWQALHLQPQYKQLWRQACLRDVGRDCLIELTGDRRIFTDDDLGRSSAPSEDGQQENNNINWKAIYKRWFRSRHIGKWPSMTTELKGHSGQVLDVKFSGDRVVTSGDDGTIRIWDGWTGYCVMVLTGHLNSVTSISLRPTPDLWLNPLDIPHDLIASGSSDCSVKIWDMKDPSGDVMVTCRGHTGPVNCVTFGENTSMVASASDDCSVRIWLISTGHCTCYYTLSNLGDWVEYTRFWGSDTLLYVTDHGQLALFSITDQETLSSVKLMEANGKNATPLSPGVQGAVLRGQTALVLTAANGLFAWENKSNDSIVHNFPVIGPHYTGIERGSCLAMHGALVAIGTRFTGAVYVYHLVGEWENQFTEIHCVLQVSESTVTAISIEDDGQGPCLAAGGGDGVVKVYRWFPPGF